MHILHGAVTSGFGLAAHNLAHVMPLIAARMGLGTCVPGTLNLQLPNQFLVTPDAIVTVAEYDGNEHLKLKRCVIQGVQAVIVRPHQHETVPGWGHGPSYLELASVVHLRSTLQLSDGDLVQVEVGGDSAWWTRARPKMTDLLDARLRRYARRTLRVVRSVWQYAGARAEAPRPDTARSPKPNG